MSGEQRHRVGRASVGAAAARRRGCFAAFVLALSVLPSGVSAETLRQVLSEVFARNPTVNAARQGVRATRETITQAEAGRKPTVNALGDYGYRREIVDPTGNVGANLSRNPRSAALAISQPIFDKLQIANRPCLADTCRLNSAMYSRIAEPK